MKTGYKAVIGLGAIGAPLSHLLWKEYKDEFILLSSEEIAVNLKKNDIFINGEPFSPRIITKKEELEKPIDVVFVCVKNYSLELTVECLKNILTDETKILPLQNGLYSYRYMKEQFPNNVVLEGFAQGPNTRIKGNEFVYEKSGTYHFGTSYQTYEKDARFIYNILNSAGIPCCWEENIQYSIWKKLMLNVAGNAMTAITEIDYSMMRKSTEAQKICIDVMREFQKVASFENVHITDEDIEDVMKYFLGYDKGKHTSMLEDVLNKRKTENEYIAGYVVKLAQKNKINTPLIELLYLLMKIKEDVYLKNV